MKTETPDSSLAVTGAVFLSTSSSFANIKKKKVRSCITFIKAVSACTLSLAAVASAGDRSRAVRASSASPRPTRHG